MKSLKCTSSTKRITMADLNAEKYRLFGVCCSHQLYNSTNSLDKLHESFKRNHLLTGPQAACPFQLVYWWVVSCVQPGPTCALKPVEHPVPLDPSCAPKVCLLLSTCYYHPTPSTSPRSSSRLIWWTVTLWACRVEKTLTSTKNLYNSFISMIHTREISNKWLQRQKSVTIVLQGIVIICKCEAR